MCGRSQGCSEGLEALESPTHETCSSSEEKHLLHYRNGSESRNSSHVGYKIEGEEMICV